MARSTRGFWKGLAAGLLIGFAAVIVLALLYPARSTPRPGDASAAAPQELPSRAGPEAASAEALIRGDLPRPLVDLRNAADPPPRTSPSLFPGADD